MTNEIFMIPLIIWYHNIRYQKTNKKRYTYMNIKLKIIKIHLELLRIILHFLLNFKKPIDKIVVYYSQRLDEVIVKYYKCKATLPHNRVLFNNTLGSFSKEFTIYWHC